MMLTTTNARVAKHNIEIAQSRLDECFSRIAEVRERRGRRLYFIEHDLADDEVSELHIWLTNALQDHGVRSDWWASRPLPLLVAATEFGYQYEGNGTEYWPRLAARLHYEFDNEARSKISAFFESESARFNGATPPDSAWARAFCHIAWPIAHSALPKDVRLPLAQTLARLPIRIADADDDSLYDAIRAIRTDWHSQRYESWLHERSLVVPIARKLLGAERDDDSILSSQFWDRVCRDIRSEARVHSELAEARRRQRRLRRSIVVRESVRDHAGPLWGRFCLAHEANSFRLLGELPELPLSARKRLQVPLRNQSWRPAPWNLDDIPPLPRHAILQCAPFPISFRSLKRIKEGATFFSSPNESVLSEEDAALLSSVRFQLSDVLLFEPPVGEGELAYQMFRPLRQAELVFAVVADIDVPKLIAGVRVIGSVGGGAVLEVDTSAAAARSWLGLSTSKPVANAGSWRWTFPTPLPDDSAWPRFNVTDPLAIEFINASGVEIEYESDGTTIGSWSAPCNGIVSLQPSLTGRYRVRLKIDGQVQGDRQFEIVDGENDECQDPCSIELFSSTMTSEDLVHRQLVLDIDSVRQWDNVSVRLRLEGTSASVQESMSLPRRIGPREPIWDDLLSQLGDAGLRLEVDFILSVSVANVAHRTWRLEGCSEEVWWENANSLEPQPVSDSASYNVCFRPASSPLNSPVDRALPAPVLLLPRDETDQTLDFDGLFLAQCESHWPSDAWVPPLLRKLESEDPAVGLRDLATAYVQFGSARANNPIAELHRHRTAATMRRAMLKVCCGERWVRALQTHWAVETVAPIQEFWRSARALGVPSIPNDYLLFPSTVLDGLGDAWGEALPSDWWVGPVVELNDTHGEQLDAALQQIIGRRDFYTETATWQTAIRNATWRLNGDFLADLVVPPHGADELLRLPVVDSELGELALIVDEWRRRYARSIAMRVDWDGELIGILLSLLLTPWNLRRHGWEALLPGLLEDRTMVRAVAFVAWRVEQQSRLSVYA